MVCLLAWLSEGGGPGFWLGGALARDWGTEVPPVQSTGRAPVGSRGEALRMLHHEAEKKNTEKYPVHTD